MNSIRLLADTANQAFGNGMSVAERLQNGGKMILVLMAFVFSVIFIIFLSQTIISGLINGLQNKKDTDTPKQPVVKKEEPVVAPSVQTTPDNDGDVTVAVITAALAAYLASTSPDGNVMPFRVVSFKRKNSGKPWNS